LKESKQKKVKLFLKSQIVIIKKFVNYRDGLWPDQTLLLSRSKKGADPALTRLIFDPTQ